MAPLVSTRYQVTYPNTNRSDAADVPLYMSNIVAGLEQSVMYGGQGTLAARPAAGKAGRIYVQTDVTPHVEWYDNGTTWDNFSGVGGVAPGTVTTAMLDPNVPILPIGGMLDWPWAAASIPSWALLAYGQLLTQATYAALQVLADAANRPYGGAAGANFNMPDLRGRVFAGKDDMGGTAANRITAAISGTGASAPGAPGTTLGCTLGAEGIVLTTGQLPAHNHALSGAPSLSGSPALTGGINGAYTGASVAYAGTGVGVVAAGGHAHSIAAVRSPAPGANGSGLGPWDATLAGATGHVQNQYFGGQVELNAGVSGGGAQGYSRSSDGVGDHGHSISDPSHNHGFNDPGHGHGHTFAVNAGSLAVGLGSIAEANTGGGGTHQNLPPTVVVNKLMRAL